MKNEWVKGLHIVIMTFQKLNAKHETADLLIS